MQERSSEWILGIDPGSARTGYALARFSGQRLVEAEMGTWSVRRSSDRSVSLAHLAEQARSWLVGRSPAVAVVESLFHHKNARSALVLSEARGVLLAVLGEAGITVVEYSPAAVKKTICGFGGADKQQLRRALVKTVPGVAPEQIENLPEDASDALALVICHRVHAAHRALLGRVR